MKTGGKGKLAQRNKDRRKEEKKSSRKEEARGKIVLQAGEYTPYVDGVG